VYDVAGDWNDPVLFGPDGSELVRFDNITDDWELVPVNDSSLIYRDGGVSKLISFPHLAVLQEFVADYGGRPVHHRHALSPNDSHFAYLTAKRIVVCDLQTGNVHYLPNGERNGVPFSPILSLCRDGRTLIHTLPDQGKFNITLFQLSEEGYRTASEPMPIPLDGRAWNLGRDWFLGDDVLVSNYAILDPAGVSYQSVLVGLPNEGQTESMKLSVWDGYVGAYDVSGEPSGTFRVTRIGPEASSTAVYRLEEVAR
jgi:hypothetical protein